MAEKALICSWSFLHTDASVQPRSYASAVAQPTVSLAQLPTPMTLDGKTTVTISEEGYQVGLENCKHMLLAHLHLAAGEKPYSPTHLHKKLTQVWGEIGQWRAIPMGKGYFTFKFAFDEAVSKVWAQNAVSFKLGVLCFMRWSPNFSPANQRNTNTQVWVRLWDLGLQFIWEPVTLFEIPNGIGVPIKIDQNTLERRFGLFARVLVDVDLSCSPPCELVVRRSNCEIVMVEVEHERLPNFCSHYGNVGHKVTACKLVPKPGSVVVEENQEGRGCSRKPRRHRRKFKQVYVAKEADKGKLAHPNRFQKLVIHEQDDASEDGSENVVELEHGDEEILAARVVLEAVLDVSKEKQNDQEHNGSSGGASMDALNSSTEVYDSECELSSPTLNVSTVLINSWYE
ncbi:hypothetical protein ACLB2K_063365 [Fragaria x ananassa]